VFVCVSLSPSLSLSLSLSVSLSLSLSLYAQGTNQIIDTHVYIYIYILYTHTHTGEGREQSSRSVSWSHTHRRHHLNHWCTGRLEHTGSSRRVESCSFFPSAISGGAVMRGHTHLRKKKEAKKIENESVSCQSGSLSGRVGKGCNTHMHTCTGWGAAGVPKPSSSYHSVREADLFGVWGLGFGVWGLGFGVWGLGFGVWSLGFGVWGLGLRSFCHSVLEASCHEYMYRKHIHI
jgi:hypothetical protein